MEKHASQKPTFIDLFSGCGGLSLGLSQAGWQGLFAVERSPDAFKTFKANFLGEDSRYRFDWPQWIAQRAHSIDEVLDHHLEELERLRGKVDLIAGGPPCQGFSFAGKRNGSDPRNKLFERYVAFVRIIRPRFLVLENVPGMKVAHVGKGKKASGQTYYEKLIESLEGAGYSAEGKVLDSSDFGVPQRRARLVVVGVRNDIEEATGARYDEIFEAITTEGARQLLDYGRGKPVSAKQAISDLVVMTRGATTIEYTGTGSRAGYLQLKYKRPVDIYQVKMNEGVSPDRMNSMRLARHREDVEAKFQLILDNCPRGVNLSNDARADFGMLKHRTVPMSASQPAPTLTTLPDDILHYNDPRILTVRECARLQSFPDWFVFEGKYTTGGDRRKVECPRYTQVGNAVPPLLARAIGVGMLNILRAASVVSQQGQKMKGRRIVKRSAAFA